MTKNRISISLLTVFLLAGCAEGHEKQSIGTLLGAGVGAVLGAQIGKGKGQWVGVAIGSLAGAWLGSEAGKKLDEADKAEARQTTQSALENNQSGQTLAWHNPNSGHSGSTTPLSVEKIDGKDCREFETTITVDAKTEPSTGRACREADGSWHIVP